MPTPELRTFTAKSEDLPCPCGGFFGLASVEDGGSGIFHTVPFCTDFELREPQDFVAWVRAHADAAAMSAKGACS